MMNTAAPDPSDAAIAQAFRLVKRKFCDDCADDFVLAVERHAAEIDASAPAAAVGGDRNAWLAMTDVLKAAWAKAEPNHGVTLYPESYEQTFRDMARAVLSATAAAPVGEQHPTWRWRINEGDPQATAWGCGPLKDAPKGWHIELKNTDWNKDGNDAPVGGFVVDSIRSAVADVFADCEDEVSESAIVNAVMRALASPAAQSSAKDGAHTTEDDYQHFLSYSGLDHSPLLRYAYYHGADIGMEKPKEGDSCEVLTWFRKAMAGRDHPYIDQIISALESTIGRRSAKDGVRVGEEIELPLPKLPKAAFLSLHASYYSEAQLVVLMRHAQQIAWDAAIKATTAAGLVDGVSDDYARSVAEQYGMAIYGMQEYTPGPLQINSMKRALETMRDKEHGNG